MFQLWKIVRLFFMEFSHLEKKLPDYQNFYPLFSLCYLRGSVLN